MIYRSSSWGYLVLFCFFPNIIFQRDCPFSVVCLSVFCRKLIDHKHTDLFLFHLWLGLLHQLMLLWDQVEDASAFVLCGWGCFGYRDAFVMLYKFNYFFSCFWGNCPQSFGKNHTDYVGWFGQCEHFSGISSSHTWTWALFELSVSSPISFTSVL